MKQTLFFLLVISGFSCFGQDVIVLRKNESEIQCKIFSLNDSLISYKLWRSTDTSMHTLRHHEVLSYMIDKSNKTLRENLKQGDEATLGRYYQGETMPGYVINNLNDTLYGYVRIENVALSQLEVNFTDGGGTTKTYFPADLKGYGYGEIHYESLVAYRKAVTNGRRIKDGRLFLHREINGKAKLYRLYTLFFPASTRSTYQKPPFYLGRLKSYFIIDGPTGRASTKGRSSRGTLLKAINDPWLAGQLVDVPLSQISIPVMVNRYNGRQ